MDHGRPGCTATRTSNATGLTTLHRSQVGRDGQIVRLTTLQPTGANDAKRARVDGGAEGGQQEQQEEEAPKEELSLAAQAEKAVAELGAAAGWDEEIRARCVFGGLVVLVRWGLGHVI